MNRLNHITQLDALRGIAILLVFIAHFMTVNESSLLAENTVLGTIIIKFSLFGLKGVELFFLLSGFLITRILLNSKESPQYFKVFFMRRFLRIFPLYYFVLVLSLILYPVFFQVPEEANAILNGQWKLWTYLSNINFYLPVQWDINSVFPAFGHFWSLSVEEHFYLLWPFLIFFSKEINLPKKMLYVIFLSFFSWVAGYYIDFFQWTTLRYAAALALGGLIAYYELTQRKILIAMTEILWQKYYVLIFLFLFIVFFPRSLGDFTVFIVYLGSLILFGSLILLALFKQMWLLQSNFLMFIGKISYGIYIYHGVLRPFFKEYIYLSLFDKFGDEHAILMTTIYAFVSLCIIVLISWISWEFFEKQVLKLKRYYTYA